MSPENRKAVIAAAKDVGSFLDGKLAPIPGLRVRNSYAHVWERVKSKMGCSYKECNDEQTSEIIEFILSLKTSFDSTTAHDQNDT